MLKEHKANFRRQEKRVQTTFAVARKMQTFSFASNKSCFANCRVHFVECRIAAENRNDHVIKMEKLLFEIVVSSPIEATTKDSNAMQSTLRFLSTFFFYVIPVCSRCRDTLFQMAHMPLYMDVTVLVLCVSSFRGKFM